MFSSFSDVYWLILGALIRAGIFRHLSPLQWNHLSFLPAWHMLRILVLPAYQTLAIILKWTQKYALTVTIPLSLHHTNYRSVNKINIPNDVPFRTKAVSATCKDSGKCNYHVITTRCCCCCCSGSAVAVVQERSTLHKNSLTLVGNRSDIPPTWNMTCSYYCC